MASTDGPMIEEIRTILAGGEDITHGWSDERIVEEASRRVGNRADNTAETAVRAMDRWGAVIAEIRSETDNDGQERQTSMTTG
jgi:hypothetical protein